MARARSDAVDPVATAAAAFVAAVEPADAARAADILSRALAELLRDPAGIDGLGAPLTPRAWPGLREELKAAIRQVGIQEASRRIGAAPDYVRDLVYRNRAPGLGRRLRLAQLVAPQS